MTAKNRIKFWRQQRGWTLQQLADAAGSSRAQIDKLERGARRLTVDWMVRLAGPLGCDPRSLMLPGGAAPDEAAAMPLYRLGRAGRLRFQAQVLRPYFLGQAPAAYAVIAADQGTAPLLLAGQTAFLDPQRKPRPERAVLVAGRDQRCAFYILVRADKEKILLRRSDVRPSTLSLRRADIGTIHAVCGVADAAHAS